MGKSEYILMYCRTISLICSGGSTAFTLKLPLHIPLHVSSMLWQSAALKCVLFLLCCAVELHHDCVSLQGIESDSHALKKTWIMSLEGERKWTAIIQEFTVRFIFISFCLARRVSCSVIFTNIIVSLDPKYYYLYTGRNGCCQLASLMDQYYHTNGNTPF